MRINWLIILFLFSFLFSVGQTPMSFLSNKGNVTYPMPTSLLTDGNTVAWYIASATGTITKDGSNLVSRWNDTLGSGHDLIQATGTNQPLWSATGVLFDGVDNYMQTAGFTLNQPVSIYLVTQQITWANSRVFIDGSTSDHGEIAMSPSSPSLVVYAGTFSASNSYLALNTWGIIRVVFNGASSSFQINQTGQLTGNYGALALGGITLAKIISFYANVQFKEIIYRKVADAVSDQQLIYNYLKTRYGLY